MAPSGSSAPVSRRIRPVKPVQPVTCRRPFNAKGGGRWAAIAKGRWDVAVVSRHDQSEVPVKVRPPRRAPGSRSPERKGKERPAGPSGGGRPFRPRLYDGKGTG